MPLVSTCIRRCLYGRPKREAMDKRKKEFLSLKAIDGERDKKEGIDAIERETKRRWW
jgi:hypothetical protein